MVLKRPHFLQLVELLEEQAKETIEGATPTNRGEVAFVHTLHLLNGAQMHMLEAKTKGLSPKEHESFLQACQVLDRLSDTFMRIGALRRTIVGFMREKNYEDADIVALERHIASWQG